MKLINTTKNTVYLEDVDVHLPYRDGEIETIEPDLLKRSRALRGFILSGMFEIVEHDPEERIEASIVYMLNKHQDKIPQTHPQAEESVNEPIKVESTSDDIEVKVHGIFFDAGGYGKVNRNLAIGLDKAGFKVKVDPKRSQNQLKESELKGIARLTKTNLSKDYILIDSIIPSFAEFSTGKYKVLYTTIESYSLPKQFVECCQLYDEIWLTSEWSAELLRKEIDKPIYTVVTGADHGLYTEEGPKFDFKPNVNDFVFISVFGWNYRKGYDALLKAYFDEFSSSDNVSLLIVSRYQTGTSKFHRNKIKDDIDKIMDQFPNKDLPHVVRYSKITPEEDMPKIYRAADCFVLPTRGEGGGLPPLEASLCGLPIIMTNCSGQQGYLREEHSYPIEIDNLVEIQPGQMHLHYWDGQLFPALTSDKFHNDLRRTMRNVFEDQQKAKEKNKRMKNFIMSNFTWNNTIQSASERLQAIHKKMRGK